MKLRFAFPRLVLAVFILSGCAASPDVKVSRETQRAPTDNSQENSSRLSRLSHYEIGKTTLSEFRAQWNASDPSYGLCGIVGFGVEGTKKTYTMGYFTLPSSASPKNHAEMDEYSLSMAEDLGTSIKRGGDTPPVMLYAVTFTDGVLTEAAPKN